MWSIYLGNKEAFINENINLIRKDIDIFVPELLMRLKYFISICKRFNSKYE
jgi:hypothetical protein